MKVSGDAYLGGNVLIDCCGVGVGDYDMVTQPAVRPSNPMRRDTASLKPDGEYECCPFLGWVC